MPFSSTMLNRLSPLDDDLSWAYFLTIVALIFMQSTAALSPLITTRYCIAMAAVAIKVTSIIRHRSRAEQARRAAYVPIRLLELSGRLNSLPDGIIIHILISAEASAIVAAAASCRRVRRLVRSSCAVRYKVAVASSGIKHLCYSDNCSPSDCLAALTARIESWRTFRPRFATSIRFEETFCHPLILHGGALYALCLDLVTDQLSLAQTMLPSLAQPSMTPKWTKTQLSNRVLTFAVDRAQDLLISVESGELDNSQICIRHRRLSLPNLAPHNLSVAPDFHLQCPEPYDLAQVAICGSHVGLIVNNNQTSVLVAVWNWLTGDLVLDVIYDVAGLQFLSEHDLLLVSPIANAVHLYRFQLDGKGRGSFCLKLTFGLPPLRPGCRLGRVYLHPPALPHHGDGDSSLGFAIVRPDMQLVVMSLKYTDDQESNYCLFSKQSTFLAWSQVGSSCIPWDQWGEMHTRMVRGRLPPYGALHALLRFLVVDRDGDCVLLDFNVASVGRETAKFTSINWLAAPDAVHYRSDVLTEADTAPLHAPDLFMDRYRTRLPYVQTSCNMPRHYDTFYCDHERIVGVKWPGESDDLLIDVMHIENKET